MSLQNKADEEGVETPFVLAVTVKDEHGNIDLGAIAESEYLISSMSVTSGQYLSHVVNTPPLFVKVRREDNIIIFI